MNKFPHTVLCAGLFLLLVLCTAALATDYNYTVTYEGPFQTRRLFQRSEKNPIWLPCPGTPKLITDLTCSEAVSTLHSKGTFTGNLSSSGSCLGSDEAPEYSYGNYLNYLDNK